MNSDRKSTRSNRREFLAGSLGGFVGASLGALSASATVSAARYATSGLASSAAPVQRVIIDTDPGVDDALAILLALRSPELKVEAITPVAGNVPLDYTLRMRCGSSKSREERMFPSPPAPAIRWSEI
jgi:Inosine-uridine preferring nucleoside hydrolase